MNPSAFKRLMGRYATREAEVDRMLRAERFVDLYAVVRRALRASVERYSIKDLEPFYGFSRAVKLADANINLRVVERALEAAAIDAITPDVRTAVEGYNLDDCKSALRLRDWLEQLRARLKLPGRKCHGPSSPMAQLRKRSLIENDAKGACRCPNGWHSTEPSERNEEQQALWLLAHLLDFHRREAKAPWWEFFRLRAMTEEELLDEKAAVGGLHFVTRIETTKRGIPTDRYSYPPQETDIRSGDELHLPDGTDFGTVEAIDRATRVLGHQETRSPS